MQPSQDSQESDLEDNHKFSQISTKQTDNNSDQCSDIYSTRNSSNKVSLLSNQYSSDLKCSQHKLPIEYIVLCTNYLYHYQNCCRKCFISQQPNFNANQSLGHQKVCKFCNQIHRIYSPKSCNIFTMHFEIEELILDYTVSFKQLIKAFEKSLHLIKNVLLQINYNSLKKDCLLCLQKLYNNLKNTCIEHMTQMGIDVKQFCKDLQSQSGEFNFQRSAITFDSIHRCMNFLLNEQKQWEDQERQIERFINNQFDGYQNVRKKIFNEEHAFYIKEDSAKFSQKQDSQSNEIGQGQMSKDMVKVDGDEEIQQSSNLQSRIDLFAKWSHTQNYNSIVQGCGGGFRRYRGDDNSINILDNPQLTQKCTVKDVLLIQNSYEMIFNKYSNPLLYDYSFSDIFNLNFFSFINQNPINLNKKSFHQEEFTPKEASLIHDLHQQIKLIFLERYERLKSSLIAQTKASLESSEQSEGQMNNLNYDKIYNNQKGEDSLLIMSKDNYQYAFQNLGDKEQISMQNLNKNSSYTYNNPKNILNNLKSNYPFKEENPDLNISQHNKANDFNYQSQQNLNSLFPLHEKQFNLINDEIVENVDYTSNIWKSFTNQNDNSTSGRQIKKLNSSKQNQFDQILNLEKPLPTMKDSEEVFFKQSLQQQQYSHAQAQINSSEDEQEEEEKLQPLQEKSTKIQKDQQNSQTVQLIEGKEQIDKNKTSTYELLSSQLGENVNDLTYEKSKKEEINFYDDLQQQLNFSSSSNKETGNFDKFSNNINSLEKSDSNIEGNFQLTSIEDSSLNKNKNKGKSLFSLEQLSCKTCDDVQQVQQGKFFKCGNVSYFDFNERYGFFYSMTDICSIFLFDFENKRVEQQILVKEISQKEHNQIIIVKVSSTEIAVWQEERFYEIIIFNVNSKKFYKFRFAGINSFQIDDQGQNEAEINVFSIFQGSIIGIQLNNRLFKINYKKRKVIRIFQLQTSKQPTNYNFLQIVQPNRHHYAAMESPLRSTQNQMTQTSSSFLNYQNSNNNHNNSEQIQIFINGQQQSSYNNHSLNSNNFNNQFTFNPQQSVSNTNNNNNNNNHIVPWTIMSNSVESNEDYDIGQQNNINSFESEYEQEEQVEQFEDFKVVVNKKFTLQDLEKCPHYNTQPDDDCVICEKNKKKLQIPRYCLYMRSDQSIWQMNLHNGQMNEWIQNDNSQVVQQRFFPINENKWFYYKDTVDEQWIIVYNNQVQQGEYLQLKMMEFDRPILNKYWPLLNQENQLVLFDYKAEQFHNRIFDPADLVQQYIKQQIQQSYDEVKFEEYDKIDNYAFVKTFGKYLVFILSEGDIYYIK